MYIKCEESLLVIHPKFQILNLKINTFNLLLKSFVASFYPVMGLDIVEVLV